MPRQTHSLSLITITVLLGCAMTPVTRANGGVLPHRSWQFQDIGRDYLLDTIPKAAAAGMNRIQLSHNIVMEAERLWEGDKHEYRLQIVREATQLAHKHGLKVDIWTHELSGVPENQFRDPATGKPVLTPELWKWVEAKYNKLFDLVPDIDGLVLTFAETQFCVYREKVVSDKPPADRVADLIEVLNNICLKRNKLLIVRTFVHNPDSLGFLHQAVLKIADRINDTSHLVIMTKCVPHDWQPYYPFNPVLGDVAGLPQIVEIDLGQEYTGQSRIPHCEVNYVKCVLDYAREKNVVGAVARIERYDRHAINTPNEVNIHAFNRLLNDDTLTIKQLWQEWATQRYGDKAAPLIIRALKRTFEITNIIYFPLEHWVTNHSRFPSWDWGMMELYNAGNYKWIKSPKQRMAWDELKHPSEETLIKIDHEKDLAKRLVEMSLQDLDQARPLLSAADYDELRHYLLLTRDNVEVFRLHSLIMFGVLNYRNCVEANDTPQAELDVIRERVEQSIQSLRTWADRMQERYGQAIWPGNPGVLRSFAKEAERKLDEPRG